MPQYRKKPVVIEAMLLTFGCALEVMEWSGGKPLYDPTGKMDAMRIATLEGDMRADMGDWVIKGVKGEFYPCKPDIFDATYEPV